MLFAYFATVEQSRLSTPFEGLLCLTDPNPRKREPISMKMSPPKKFDTDGATSKNGARPIRAWRKQCEMIDAAEEMYD